jgi:hypothetical protein
VINNSSATNQPKLAYMSQPDHLQPGFDPSKLKVAQLRGILLEYSVRLNLCLDLLSPGWAAGPTSTLAKLTSLGPLLHSAGSLLVQRQED